MKRILLGLLMLALLAPTIVSAATTPTEDLGDIVSSDDMSLEKYVIDDGSLGDTFLNYYSSSVMGLTNSDNEAVKTGLVPITGRVLAYVYTTKPVSSTHYFADLLDNMGFPTVQTAQAQGTGYKVLTPMIPLWKAFRNVAYSVYIIIFAIVGLMIMFRTKVNAQTVISIQNALPNLIITLILITFSYAIAGFLVDIMYFLIYFITFLAGANNLLDPNKAIERLMNYNAWSVLFEGRNAIVEEAARGITDVFMGLTLSGTVKKIIQGLPGSPENALAYLIVSFAFAIAMIKLIIALLKAYVMIFVQTITAPLQILPNALPGSTSFMGWLKKTASYLAPFPVVAAMFIFAAILIGPSNGDYLLTQGGDTNPFGITDQARVLNADGSLWLPPFISVQYASGSSPNSMLAVIGFLIILMTPAATKMAQDALQVKESPYTSEIMAAIGTGTGLAGRGYGLYRGVRQKQEARQQMEQAATLTGKSVAKEIRGRGTS